MSAPNNPSAKDDCTLLVVAQYDPAACRLNRTIAVSHQEVEGLASEVQQVLRSNGWDEEASRAAQLLVMEHGVNVVDHAGTPPGSRMTLQLRLSERQAFILFRDFGKEWNLPAKLDSALHYETDSDRGRGLRIIHTIAKHIDNARQNCENVTHYIVSRFFECSP